MEAPREPETDKGEATVSMDREVGNVPGDDWKRITRPRLRAIGIAKSKPLVGLWSPPHTARSGLFFHDRIPIAPAVPEENTIPKPATINPVMQVDSVTQRPGFLILSPIGLGEFVCHCYKNMKIASFI